MKNVMRLAAAAIVVSLMFASGAGVAVTEEPSLTYDAPFPGADTGRIYYFVPKGLDLAEGLLVVNPRASIAASARVGVKP